MLLYSLLSTCQGRELPMKAKEIAKRYDASVLALDDDRCDSIDNEREHAADALRQHRARAHVQL